MLSVEARIVWTREMSSSGCSSLSCLSESMPRSAISADCVRAALKGNTIISTWPIVLTSGVRQYLQDPIIGRITHSIVATYFLYFGQDSREPLARISNFRHYVENPLCFVQVLGKRALLTNTCEHFRHLPSTKSTTWQMPYCYLEEHGSLHMH